MLRPVIQQPISILFVVQSMQEHGPSQLTAEYGTNSRLLIMVRPLGSSSRVLDGLQMAAFLSLKGAAETTNSSTINTKRNFRFPISSSRRRDYRRDIQYTFCYYQSEPVDQGRRSFETPACCRNRFVASVGDLFALSSIVFFLWRFFVTISHFANSSLRCNYFVRNTFRLSVLFLSGRRRSQF